MDYALTALQIGCLIIQVIWLVRSYITLKQQESELVNLKLKSRTDFTLKYLTDDQIKKFITLPTKSARH